MEELILQNVTVLLEHSVTVSIQNVNLVVHSARNVQDLLITVQFVLETESNLQNVSVHHIH